MFGYISPVISAMTEDQKARYRAAYCGVCHSLKKRLGAKGRIILSNDMTYLALLLSSLYEPDARQRDARCGVHPLRKQAFLTSGAVDYAADMNLLLSWYKCRDAVMDEKKPGAKAAMRALGKALKEVERAYPVQSRAVGEALEELWALEKEENPNPDRLCNLSGQMLGAVFVPKPEDCWAGELYALGEGLGRFVYWMDAYEDYDEDIKKGRFNPLKIYHGREDYEQLCRDALEMFISEATEHFETLPLEQDLDILRNVMYSGAWQRYLLLENQRKRKEEGS